MNDLERLRTIVQSILSIEVHTQELIREEIARARPSCPEVTDEEAEQLAIRFEEIHLVRMSDGAELKNHDFEPWLDGARSAIKFFYWERYRALLAEKELSSQVLGGMGNVTDRILALLENPQKLGRWDRRGMVMGHVQSGKTANYIGVVAKAADAGYRVIIIIAGLQNKLRDQTQMRVDEGLIGFSSMVSAISQFPNRTLMGVGRHDPRRRPAAFTTSHRDFHKGIAESLNVPLQNLNEPAVFVIKKNPNTLRNLIDWLRTHNAALGTESIREPMLLIDDEADNASINIRFGADEVSRINGQIRELLNLFDRSCYVGYTATPFANIFIEPENEDQMLGHDLFPKDFIVSLDAPTNYFSPSQVFLDSNSRVLKELGDYADLLPTTHKIDHTVLALPNSLKEAIRIFILVRAIRLERGHHSAHNSMLVNVSRFVDVQKQVRNEIQSFVEKLRSSIRVNGLSPLNSQNVDPEIYELNRVFSREYQDTCGLDWTLVQSRLHESISAINVIEVNSRAVGSMDYENHPTGFNVIAVGGLSLSRGLTLEGLSVSYIIRRSMMYDTLFQMGRWFGYRAGYEDLCRVWMPEEAQGWYEHITEAIEELRDELVRMQAINATPREFGLKVRSHPESLVVTARNKMGTGKEYTVRIGLANQFVETAILQRDRESLTTNLRTVERLANQMRSANRAPEEGSPVRYGRLVEDVPVQLIDEFLALFKNHPGHTITETDPVRQYIRERSWDELKDWDVLFAGVQRKNERSLIDHRLGFPLVCQRRSDGRHRDQDTLMVTSKQRVSTRGITKVGLTKSQIESAERKFEEKNPSTTNYPDNIYTKERSKPLLVVHLLAIGEESEDFSNREPVAAWSISFPRTKHTENTVEYVVNTTWHREYYGQDDTDDEFDEDW